MEGKSITEVADRLGIRRQDIYEKPEWSYVRSIAVGRKSARREAHRDRRSGQNPDTEKNRNDG